MATKNAFQNPRLPGGYGGGVGRKPTDPAIPDTPAVDPYAKLPVAKPFDDTWYQNELNRLNQLAQQSAAQSRQYASASAAQASDFAAQYQRQRQAMMPGARTRPSRLMMLAGY